MTDDIPRRNRVDLASPIEAAIRDAINMVERMGCDTRLTKAVVLLDEAMSWVADFIDGVPESKHPRQVPEEVINSHCVVCNHIHQPIGGPGCICVVVPRLEVERLRAAEAGEPTLFGIMVDSLHKSDAQVKTYEDAVWAYLRAGDKAWTGIGKSLDDMFKSLNGKELLLDFAKWADKTFGNR